jgi:hypothetical protein
MARQASLAHSVDPLPSHDGSTVDERVDFETWLLPQTVPDASERAIRFCSVTSGPILFAIALASVISWIV